MCKWHSKEKVNSSDQSAIDKKYICAIFLLVCYIIFQKDNVQIQLFIYIKTSVCPGYVRPWTVLWYQICCVVTYCYLAYKIIINFHWKFKNWNEYTLIAVNLWNYHANHDVFTEKCLLFATATTNVNFPAQSCRDISILINTKISWIPRNMIFSLIRYTNTDYTYLLNLRFQNHTGNSTAKLKEDLITMRKKKFDR